MQEGLALTQEGFICHRKGLPFASVVRRYGTL